MTTMTTEATDIPCPSCGTTTGVRLVTGTPPKVRVWSCAACRTDWAITVVNPRPFLDRLTATVELAAARPVLREIITLADQASTLTDDQLQFRLRALAVCALLRSDAAHRSPAGHRLSPAPSPGLLVASRYHKTLPELWGVCRE
ncbi:MAG: hypothetical protein ACRDRA_20920 [Pseudonocardiaceae bacterium]